MGKQGPCYHCGVTSTPLWRNGPPDKPVLCNACGSRWRTKGTLLNYTPLHARADPAHCEDHGATRVKSISINKNKEVKLLKRKHASDNVVASGGVPIDYSLGSQKLGEEDISNRSSSGSAMSNSDLQFESADASDLTGPAQSVVWDTMVPSRKRTCVNRLKQSSVEKLTKDLHAIMHEQQSSCFSGSSEEDLLFESSTPMCSFEIGHGAVIFRDPGSVAREEESEASSLSVDRKLYKASVAYSRAESLPPHSGGKGVNFRNSIPKTVKVEKPTEQGSAEEQLKREISQHLNLQILGNHNSTLPTTNLRDAINIDEFMKHLTYEEEQQLLKYLPLGDKARLSDRLRIFFGSSEFKENLSAFPQLLAEGISGGSFLGAKLGDSETLKKLTLFSLMRRKEVESNHMLKDNENISSSSSAGLNMLHAIASSNLAGGKRLRGVPNQNFSEARVMSPKRPCVKGTCEDKEPIDNDGCCLSPGSLFAFALDGSVMLDSSSLADEDSDQDLLLDMPSNSSFPQAELLLPSLSFGSHFNQASNSTSSVHRHLPPR